MERYLSDEIQKLVDKYHCKAERYEDAAENDTLVFYARTYTERYLISRICLDDYDLSRKTDIDSFLAEAEKELKECDIALIDKANAGLM